MNKVILIVLDGYGIAPPGPGNAITLATTANLKSYQYLYPHTTLRASGESVGLPEHEAGNTEVGHINLGAGRIIYQDLPRINLSIADGTFYKNPTFLKAVEHLRKNDSNLHLLGLIGEGTVHSSMEHLFALLFLAKEQGIKKVYIHVIADGRDSPPQSAIEIISRLDEKLTQLGIGKIATVMGRYYAMDRDRRWERTEKAYNCLTKGEGQSSSSATTAVKEAYLNKKTDEFIPPTNIFENGRPITTIGKGDVVVFFNYRVDRPRQLSKAFVLENFEIDANKSTSFDPYASKYLKSHQKQPEEIFSLPFKRGPKIENLYFVTLTQYEERMPAEVAFPPIRVRMPLGRVLSEKGIQQLRVAESEKERFVTYYFNGQQEIPLPEEDRLIIPSPKVPTYDLKPEMSAQELTETLLQKINTQEYGFILVNFANPDMVGHTGNIEATIKAVETIDGCVGKIVNTALLQNYSILITGDHGNAEEKISLKTGGISTEHTSNPVPLIIISKELRGRGTKLLSGILADVAPTILNLLEIEKPTDMTGRNLLEGL